MYTKRPSDRLRGPFVWAPVPPISGATSEDRIHTIGRLTLERLARLARTASAGGSTSSAGGRGSPTSKASGSRTGRRYLKTKDANSGKCFDDRWAVFDDNPKGDEIRSIDKRHLR